MNRFFSLISVAILASFTLIGCDNLGGDGVKPTVRVIPIETTNNSISFVVSATDADEVRYMLYDGESITADRVLAEGTAIDGKSQLVTVERLTQGTRYYVVAAARNSSAVVMSDTQIMDTKGSGGNGGNGGNQRPDNPDAKELTITRTKEGRWYDTNNYYVTLVAESGEQLILDFYTTRETMGVYLPYGQYSLADYNDPFTIARETSYIQLTPDQPVDQGCKFTDGYCSVDVANGYYSLYFEFTYSVDNASYTVYGTFNGPMSGASVPAGDNVGADKLIEVLEVGATSFKFRINAEEGQYWRCSVVDKRVYDQQVSNPGAWVLTYGFMLDGTRTFNWENGKICEHVEGYLMEVSSSTDYLILAALMDYSGGSEYNFLGGIEIAQIRTEAEAEGTGTVDVNIKEINVNDIVFDCTLSEDVWCCYVALLETDNLVDIKNGKYELAGYNSYEECMLSLIPTLSYDSMRQFLESEVDYKWDYLKYNTSYTMCIKVVDMNGGASYMELDPFTTR